MRTQYACALVNEWAYPTSYAPLCRPRLLSRSPEMATGELLNNSSIDSFSLQCSLLYSSCSGRDSCTRRCCGYSGGDTSSTERLLRAGSEAETAPSRGGGHSLDSYQAAQSPPTRHSCVPESSGAQTDVEGHCRCSQEPCSQPTSPRRQSGGSSFP